MDTSFVSIRKIRKVYGNLVALNDVDLAIQQGQFVVLLGPSGSGKTTLLSILGGFIQPTSGQVIIDGEDVTSTPPARRPTVTVFQDYALFPHMSVRRNIAFGLTMRKVPRSERIRLVERVLTTVGLEGLGDRRIDQLSGGQRQRVALARAIVVEPAVLLLDEPLGALDLKIRQQMQEELVQLQRRIETTFVHVTHDQEEAMNIGDVVVVINEGRIEDVGPPERVYLKPASLFTARFMGDSNIPDRKTGRLRRPPCDDRYRARHTCRRRQRRRDRVNRPPLRKTRTAQDRATGTGRHDNVGRWICNRHRFSGRPSALSGEVRRQR